MAALRDIARDFAAEIRDGIGWTIVYRTGRSWNALTIWSDIWNGEWETDDLNDAIGILKADPDAVIVNGYYCGHFGEDMTIDEIAAGIRWHYGRHADQGPRQHSGQFPGRLHASGLDLQQRQRREPDVGGRHAEGQNRPEALLHKQGAGPSRPISARAPPTTTSAARSSATS